MEEGLWASIGWFRIGVVTYSRWSKRHLPQVELLLCDPSENLCPVRGGQLQPGGVLIKQGQCDRGYWSRSIESSGSLPPSVGIPLDHLVLALDIPSEFSRQASFSNTRWASQTLVLEIDCQTRSAGLSATSRDFRRDRFVPCLIGEGRVTTVSLFTRWEPLRHCTVMEFVAPCQREK